MCNYFTTSQESWSKAEHHSETIQQSSTFPLTSCFAFGLQPISSLPKSPTGLGGMLGAVHVGVANTPLGGAIC